jgi:gliding motility-associated-like protein
LNGGFQYSWVEVGDSVVIDTVASLGSIKAGLYEVTVTDDSACVRVDTFELTQPDKITFTVSNTVANSCYNVADGTVLFDSLQGGRGIYDLFRFYDATTNEEVAKFNVRASDTTGSVTFGFFDSEANAEIANFNVTAAEHSVSFEKALKSGDYKVRVSDNTQQCHSDTVILRVYSKRPEIKFNNITDNKLPECLKFDVNGNPSNDGQFTVNMFAPVMSAFILPDSTASLKLFYSLDGGTADTNNVFSNLTAGEHIITIGYDSMMCAIDTVHVLNSKSSFAITEAGFYQNGTSSPAIFTCPDNELSAFVSASGNFQYSFYAQYIEEPVEEKVVPVDTAKADSTVAYVSRLRKLRFYADSLPADSTATNTQPVEEVKKPAYKKLETINGVVYAVFGDSTATNKGWSYFMPYGGETYYFVSVSDGHCMDIDSIKATSMRPVNKLNARLIDDGSYKLINGRYEVAEGALVQFEANTPEFEFGNSQMVFSENFWTWRQISGGNGSALIPELDSIGRGNPMTAKTYGEMIVQAIDTVVFTAYDDIYHIDTTLSCSYTDKLEINSINGIKPMEVFTPNGDEYNETWGISGLSSYANVTIYVFNRWGGRVWQYSGSGPDYEAHKWDGRNAKNKPLPSGTYYYVIQCSDDVLVGKKVTGPVTIIR